ncbi:MAG: hypothetical protein KME04_08945 [Pleurocapsa minor GSE-CHR-MK-17-07R]|jgi:hypothetical protein|nr:hypothetical protein [Pleurocapsa minor GSE-CHR-MK 17-07R]
MTQYRKFLASPVRRWLLLVSLLLVIVVVQAVIAQDSAPVDNPVADPTDMPPAEIILPPTEAAPADILPAPTSAPPADIIPPLPTDVSPTDVPPADSLPAPTDPAPADEAPVDGAPVPTEVMLPTDDPAMSLSTAEATPVVLPELPPEQTAEMTGVPGDVIASETPTVELLPPTETPVTDPPHVPPGFLLLSGASAVPEGDAFTVTLGAYGFADVSTVAVACRADAALLAGLTASTGGLLSANGAAVNDSGFKPDGQWLLVATLPGTATADSGELWALNYKLIAQGPAQILCEAQAFDASGAPLLPAAASMSLSVEGIARAADAPPTEEAVTVPTEMPTALPTDTAMPEATPEATPETTPESTDGILLPEVTPEATPEVTPETTPDPVIEPVAEVAGLSRVTGTVTVSQPLMRAVVTVIGPETQFAVDVNVDGSFALDLPAGQYALVFSAPHYLSYSLEGYFPEGTLTLPAVTLTGGDADENGVVDGADVALVMAQFGVAMPAVASHADLNGDQVVNIYDLAIVSANARFPD